MSAASASASPWFARAPAPSSPKGEALKEPRRWKLLRPQSSERRAAVKSGSQKRRPRSGTRRLRTAVHAAYESPSPFGTSSRRPASAGPRTAPASRSRSRPHSAANPGRDFHDPPDEWSGSESETQHRGGSSESEGRVRQRRRRPFSAASAVSSASEGSDSDHGFRVESAVPETGSRPGSGLASRTRPGSAAPSLVRARPGSAAPSLVRARPGSAAPSLVSAAPPRARPGSAAPSLVSAAPSRARPRSAAPSRVRSRPGSAPGVAPSRSRSRPGSGAERARPGSGAERSRPGSGAERSRPGSGAERARRPGSGADRTEAVMRCEADALARDLERSEATTPLRPTALLPPTLRTPGFKAPTPPARRKLKKPTPPGRQRKEGAEEKKKDSDVRFWQRVFESSATVVPTAAAEEGEGEGRQRRRGVTMIRKDRKDDSDDDLDDDDGDGSVDASQLLLRRMQGASHKSELSVVAHLKRLEDLSALSPRTPGLGGTPRTPVSPARSPRRRKRMTVRQKKKLRVEAERHRREQEEREAEAQALADQEEEEEEPLEPTLAEVETQLRQEERRHLRQLEKRHKLLLQLQKKQTKAEVGKLKVETWKALLRQQRAEATREVVAQMSQDVGAYVVETALRRVSRAALRKRVDAFHVAITERPRVKADLRSARRKAHRERAKQFGAALPEVRARRASRNIKHQSTVMELQVMRNHLVRKKILKRMSGKLVNGVCRSVVPQLAEQIANRLQLEEEERRHREWACREMAFVTVESLTAAVVGALAPKLAAEREAVQLAEAERLAVQRREMKQAEAAARKADREAAIARRGRMAAQQLKSAATVSGEEYTKLRIKMSRDHRRAFMKQLEEEEARANFRGNRDAAMQESRAIEKRAKHEARLVKRKLVLVANRAEAERLRLEEEALEAERQCELAENALMGNEEKRERLRLEAARLLAEKKARRQALINKLLFPVRSCVRRWKGYWDMNPDSLPALAKQSFDPWEPPSIEIAREYAEKLHFLEGKGSFFSLISSVQWIELGPGVVMYFETLRFMCVFYLVLAVLALPTFCANGIGFGVGPGERDTGNIWRTTLANQGVHETRIEESTCMEHSATDCERNPGIVPIIGLYVQPQIMSLAVTAGDLLVSGATLFFLSRLPAVLQTLLTEVTGGAVSAADYAVQVEGLPPIATRPEVKIHFSRLYNASHPIQLETQYLLCLSRTRPHEEPFTAKILRPFPPEPVDNLFHVGGDRTYMNSWVAEVNIAFSSRYVSKCMAHSTMVHKREAAKQRFLKYSANTTYRKGPHPRKARAALAEFVHAREKVDALQRYIAAGQYMTKVTAFVVFNNRASRDRCLHDYRKSSNPFYRYFMPSRLQFRDRNGFHTPLEVKPAPEPDDIIWEHTDSTAVGRFIRVWLTSLSLYALLAYGLVVFVDMATWYREVGGALTQPRLFVALMVVTGCGEVLRRIVGVMCVWERHHSRSATVASRCSKTMWVLLLVNVSYICLVYEYMSGETFETVAELPLLRREFDHDYHVAMGPSVATALTLTLFTPHAYPMVMHFVLYPLLMRVGREMAETQDRLNDMLVGPKFAVGDRYAVMIFSVCLATVFCGSMPILLPIGALGFFSAWCFDRFSILHVYRRPPQIDVQLAFRLVRFMRASLMVHFMLSLWQYAEDEVTYSDIMPFVKDSNGSLIELYDPGELGLVGEGVRWNVFPIVAMMVFGSLVLAVSRLLQKLSPSRIYEDEQFQGLHGHFIPNSPLPPWTSPYRRRVNLFLPPELSKKEKKFGWRLDKDRHGYENLYKRWMKDGEHDGIVHQKGQRMLTWQVARGVPTYDIAKHPDYKHAMEHVSQRRRRRASVGNALARFGMFNLAGKKGGGALYDFGGGRREHKPWSFSLRGLFTKAVLKTIDIGGEVRAGPAGYDGWGGLNEVIVPKD